MPPACLPCPSPLATQLTAEEHFENAEMAFAMENYDQAAKSFRRALDMEPEVRLLRGWLGEQGCCSLTCCLGCCMMIVPPNAAFTCMRALALAMYRCMHARAAMHAAPAAAQPAACRAACPILLPAAAAAQPCRWSDALSR